MAINIKTIELIAQIAIEIGEHVIPAIIKACHPESNEEQHEKYQKEISELVRNQK